MKFKSGDIVELVGKKIKGGVKGLSGWEFKGARLGLRARVKGYEESLNEDNQYLNIEWIDEWKDGYNAIQVEGGFYPKDFRLVKELKGIKITAIQKKVFNPDKPFEIGEKVMFLGSPGYYSALPGAKAYVKGYNSYGSIKHVQVEWMNNKKRKGQKDGGYELTLFKKIDRNNTPTNDIKFKVKKSVPKKPSKTGVTIFKVGDIVSPKGKVSERGGTQFGPNKNIDTMAATLKARAKVIKVLPAEMDVEWIRDGEDKDQSDGNYYKTSLRLVYREKKPCWLYREIKNV